MDELYDERDANVPESGTPEWVDWKRRRIGGHAAAAILGVHPYATIQDVYDLIAHGIESRSLTDEDERFFQWRSSLEANIARRYVHETGRKVVKTKSSVVKEFPICIVSPDRRIYNDPRGVGLLEIKSVHPALWAKYSLTGLPEFFWVQNQFYLWGDGRTWGDFAAGDVNSGRLLRFEHEADRQFHALMHQKIVKFTQDIAAGRRPEKTPDPVRLPSVGGSLVRVESLEETAVTLFDKLTTQVVEWTEINKMAEETKKSARGQLERFMEETGLEVAQLGRMRVYWREQAGRPSFDKKRLQADHPEIDLKKYETRGAPYKVLRVYPDVKEEQ